MHLKMTIIRVRIKVKTVNFFYRDNLRILLVQ